MMPTLWTLFIDGETLPEDIAREIERSPALEMLRDDLQGEVDATFWKSAPTALVDGLRQMLDVSLADVLCRAWVTHPGLQRQLRESITPERVTLFDLGEHEITSRHQPTIDVRILDRTLGTLGFDVSLTMMLQLGRLQLQDGRLVRATTGACFGTGSLRLGDTTLAAFATRELALPETIEFETPVALERMGVA